MSEDDPNFELYRFLNGDYPSSDQIRIGRLPDQVKSSMRWIASSIFLTRGDAQKLRFHGSHGMQANDALEMRQTIEKGDYYFHPGRGTKLQVEVILHDPKMHKRCYFLVLARNTEDTAVHFRTFFKTNNMTRSKLRLSHTILNQSGISYFKEK